VDLVEGFYKGHSENCTIAIFFGIFGCDDSACSAFLRPNLTIKTRLEKLLVVTPLVLCM
jgi:hypothetical protein